MRFPPMITMAGLLLCLLLLPALSPAQRNATQEAPGETGVLQTPAGEITSYTTQLQGNMDKELHDLISKSLDTFTLKNQPPRSLNLLKRRMRDDLETLRKILNSHGYFKADMSTALSGPDVTPVATFNVTPGPRFHLKDIEVSLRATTPEEQGTPLPAAEEIGLVSGAPYTSSAVLEAQSKILEILGSQERPFPEIAERKVIANRGDDTVNVSFVVTPGPRAKFGETTVEGLEHVDKEFVLMRLPWRQGQPYNATLLEKGRTVLIKTSLFAVATFEKGEIDGNGELPILVKATERKPRTFRAGLRYRTDTGPGGKLEWEHRTLFGRGEKLNLSLDADQTEQQFTASFRKPDFLHERLTLLLENSVVRERQDAYDSDSTEATAGLEYAISDRIKVTGGVGYRLSDVNDNGDKEIFGLVSLPASLRWDTRDDFLDPGSGGLLSCFFTPYFDTLGNAANFLKTQVGYSHYFQLVSGKRLILAVRGKLGVSAMDGGGGLYSIPADVRYYAGGGGSIRGYAYKTAGDLDEDEDPTGGRSLLEATAELRWRFYQDFGMVAFVDAGRYYEQTVPDVGQQLFIGAGVGARYYSAMGPIGLDIAFPLNRRDGIDDWFQIYISLGQSF